MCPGHEEEHLKVRTPGRRYLETHWHIRLAGFIAILMLSASIWFTFNRVEDLASMKPHNPHYEADRCFDCHESRGSKMKAEDCFKCHDLLTRSLLPNAVADRAKMASPLCAHPIKILDRGDRRTVTQLCLSCHDKVNGYVAMTNIANNRYVEVDMAETHPIGLMPTDAAKPRTLPLSRQTGAINCITCHDQHATDRRLRLLRLYYPGNGHPPDFRPLCNDCHIEGWVPMRRNKIDVVQEADRRHR